MGKRVPWKWVGVAAIAAALIGIALLLPKKQPGGVTGKLVSQTNWNGQAYASLVVSNGTDRLHNFMLWGEHRTASHPWQRASAGGTISFPVFPEGTFRATVPIPSTGSRRVVLYCMPSRSNQGGVLNWRYWRATLWTMVGRNPSPAFKLYVEVQ